MLVYAVPAASLKEFYLNERETYGGMSLPLVSYRKEAQERASKEAEVQRKPETRNNDNSEEFKVAQNFEKQ